MTTRSGPPGYVAIQFPLSSRATFIGGGGGCTGAGGGVGIAGPDCCWNDCESQDEITHVTTIANAVKVRVRVRSWILGRGIDSSSGRMVHEYRLCCGAEHHIRDWRGK